MCILLHSLNSSGGLAEHTHYQAKSLSAMGVDVEVLCPIDFLQGRKLSYPARRIYRPFNKRKESEGGRTNLGRLFFNGWNLIAVQWRLALEVFFRRPDAVLLDSYMEYLSPLWVWPHVLLSKCFGIVYVANLHDPVRNFVFGPQLWHTLSVRLAFLPLDVVVVHQHLPQRSGIPDRLKLVDAPVGVYDLQETTIDTKAVRAAWSVAEDKVVFLSFGFIRDNKNVDLLIRALPSNPEAVLVVMGSAQSSKNKPLQFYCDLAEEMGVADRVIFREEFVPDEALRGYFSAADVIAITYNGTFYSQSGVLNIAARARRPILASSGESPLKTSMLQFRLGEFVEPDNADAVAKGMRSLCRRVKSAEQSLEPDWEGYEQHASWERNANLLSEAISQVRGSRVPRGLKNGGERPKQATSVPPKLLYFCEQSVGGIAKNSYEQAKAIAAAGTHVEMLCPSDWVLGDLPSPSRVIPTLYPGPKHGSGLKSWSRFRFAAKILQNIKELNAEITRSGATHVMFGSYFEYLSPLWAFLMRRHARRGVTFGAMVLDPVRDYQVGPLWWHLSSVAQAYSFYRELFVHKQITLDTVRAVPGQRVTVVPHGPYLYAPSAKDREALRADLDISRDATVFLAFGHLRDNKNLDLVMEAMTRLPENVVLIVAGSEAAPGQRTYAEYRKRAQSLGVDHRIRWLVRYISEDEVHSIFTASDFAVMAYSRGFRSTSGILHVAAPLRIPLLVSCGDAPLGSMTEDYNLGLRIEPDSLDAIVNGMNRLMSVPHRGDWDKFMKDFSYDENARMVSERLFEVRNFEPC